MKKLLIAAAAALAIFSASTVPSDAAQYVTTWSNQLAVFVPVNCSFSIPTMSNSFTALGGATPNSQYQQYTLAQFTGGCNVAYTMTWTLANTSTVASSSSNCQAVGKVKDANGDTMDYLFKSDTCAGVGTGSVTGNLNTYLNPQNAVGNQLYQDQITLAISY